VVARVNITFHRLEVNRVNSESTSCSPRPARRNLRFLTGFGRGGRVGKIKKRWRSTWRSPFGRERRS